jgi:DNA polymerase-2
VLAIRVQNPDYQHNLFFQAAAAFPDLVYYDADLVITLRHAAIYHTFPLARLRATVDIQLHPGAGSDRSTWDIDPNRRCV